MKMALFWRKIAHWFLEAIFSITHHSNLLNAILLPVPMWAYDYRWERISVFNLPQPVAEIHPRYPNLYDREKIAHHNNKNTTSCNNTNCWVWKKLLFDFSRKEALSPAGGLSGWGFRSRRKRQGAFFIGTVLWYVARRRKPSQALAGPRKASLVVASRRKPSHDPPFPSHDRCDVAWRRTIAMNGKNLNETRETRKHIFQKVFRNKFN